MPNYPGAEVSMPNLNLKQVIFEFELFNLKKGAS
jgi:hypothetical protein